MGLPVSTVAYLHLPMRMREDMYACTRAQMPWEACGVVSGPVEPQTPQDTATTMWMLKNSLESHTGYAFDEEEWLWVNKEMERMNHRVLCVWHSHVDGSAAFPSQRDVDTATYPVPYVIVGAKEWTIRGFYIRNRAVQEVAINWMG